VGGAWKLGQQHSRWFAFASTGAPASTSACASTSPRVHIYSKGLSSSVEIGWSLATKERWQKSIWAVLPNRLAVRVRRNSKGGMCIFRGMINRTVVSQRVPTYLIRMRERNVEGWTAMRLDCSCLVFRSAFDYGLQCSSKSVPIRGSQKLSGGARLCTKGSIEA